MREEFTMIRFSTIALATALIASAASAMAQDRVQVGVLECRGSTAGFIVGSVTDLSCMFRSGDRAEPYHGTMRRAGVDLGVNPQVAVAWAVFAPTRGIGRGGLAGTYVGAAASATVGVGVGANALVGGSNNTIALQPVSVQGQTGLSVAAGVAGLELRPGR
jgi:hypothetical protein